MPGGRRWTAAERQAYRSAFTIGRLVDEIWILIAMSWFAFSVCVDFSGILPISGLVYLGVFGLLGAASYGLLPSILRRTMPPELSQSLPEGRFDGPKSPTAPRTYRELFRRWVRRGNATTGA